MSRSGLARAPVAIVVALAALSASAAETLPSPAQLDALARESRTRWLATPHGQMLERLLPVRLAPSSLPHAESRDARLTALYCVQCHALPSPSMHDASRWPRVVARMLPRMQGRGNLGPTMQALMRGPGAAPLAAPTSRQAERIVAYLQRHAFRPLDVQAPEVAQALRSDAGRMFEQACSQCHALPDPGQHRAAQWPDVVQRMQGYMRRTNRIVGSRPDPDEPQLDPEAIVAFLQRHAQDAR